MSYQYINPTKRGYTKVQKSKYKEVIKNYKWYGKYEVYENKDCYLIHSFEPFYIVLGNILIIPLYIVIYGISDIPRIYQEIICGLLFQKRTGSFISKTIFKDGLRQSSINETLSKIK